MWFDRRNLLTDGRVEGINPAYNVLQYSPTPSNVKRVRVGRRVRVDEDVCRLSIQGEAEAIENKA